MGMTPNAYAYGLQWYCNLGFKKIRNGCKEMTPKEKQQQLNALAAQRASAKSLTSL
jgi:hypothetical protein